MAKLELTNIPRQLELAGEFEVEDMSLDDIKRLKRDVAESDIEDQLRNVYGDIIEQAAFIRATWSKWLQFVQKVNQRALGMNERTDNTPNEIKRDSITRRFDVR